MTEKQPNHLAGENSPYLLQHAYNPVTWFPWGDAALNHARQQNKLLIISIGYAACHWCHVMEHESFENDEVAEAMNRDFIAVKVDREERPDIDHVYMSAAQAATGRGGWPLNVIALPDQRPVFAGTYYARHDWLYILKYFADLYRSHPDELLQQAGELMKGMNRQFHVPGLVEKGSFAPELLPEIYEVWLKDLDFANGGTQGAPKFPMPANLGFLLRYGTVQGQKDASRYVELTLDKMAMGGIFDHLGGGFSRYSVDSTWHVPHFEKMLYDNAQLITLYAHAFAATGKTLYKTALEETVSFVEMELCSDEGLFFASLDADSEGREGAFYTWTTADIRKVLGKEADLFIEFYSCDDHGNWEHDLNVLYRSVNVEAFAETRGISAGSVTEIIGHCKDLLVEVRRKRIHPATDVKLLTCWNALMISALTHASEVLKKPGLLLKAIHAASFYRDNLGERNGKLWRNSQAGTLTNPAFLDDYCFLITAFLDIYQTTFDQSWLSAAEMLTQKVLGHFTATDGIFLRLVSDEEPGLIIETFELSDNVIPASNSQMARNLFTLGHLLEREDYLHRSEAMLQRMIPQIKRNPSFHANWAMLLLDFITGPSTVTIEGNEAILRRKEFSSIYLPGVIFSGSGADHPDNLTMHGKTRIYVCRGKTCFSPVESVREALLLLQE